VSFPFLFGVMYGDMAHGLCLFFVATLLVIFSDSIKKSSMRGLADVRYILWMMSFFAMFNGICYNDFASIPFDAGSCYTREGPIAVRKDDECVYAIGFDPIWVLSSNELTYSNSLKMKTSVIFGVVQMSLGIFMKAFNAIHFGRWIDFFFEFLPQIVLLWALFGWMDLLIIVKWLLPWETPSMQTGSRFDSS
jgi:V-type H+-transporting ATPase subunit a